MERAANVLPPPHYVACGWQAALDGRCKNLPLAVRITALLCPLPYPSDATCVCTHALLRLACFLPLVARIFPRPICTFSIASSQLSGWVLSGNTQLVSDAQSVYPPRLVGTFDVIVIATSSPARIASAYSFIAAVAGRSSLWSKLMDQVQDIRKYRIYATLFLSAAGTIRYLLFYELGCSYPPPRNSLAIGCGYDPVPVVLRTRLWLLLPPLVRSRLCGNHLFPAPDGNSCHSHVNRSNRWHRRWRLYRCLAIILSGVYRIALSTTLALSTTHSIVV